MAAVAVADPNRPLVLDHIDRPIAWDVLTAIEMGCNVILNFFGTTNIVVRLLLHRRSLIAALGQSSVLTKPHGRISGILLESAALNIPVTLLAIPCVFVGKAILVIAVTLIVNGQVWLI